MVHLDKGLQWVNVKQKPFKQIQAYPEIIQAYYKRWYNQNPDIFRTRSIFKTLAYS